MLYQKRRTVSFFKGSLFLNTYVTYRRKINSAKTGEIRMKITLLSSITTGNQLSTLINFERSFS